jgi:hypothetical protein
MLKLDISAGNHINAACASAAKLARHPLATQAVEGAWYAFTMNDDHANLEVGPWYTPPDAGEDYPGQAFWDYCHSLGLRGIVRAHMDGSEPGVCFDFNGETVTCEPISDPTRTIGDIARDLQSQWDAKMKAASDAYWTTERKAEEARRRDEHAAKMARLSERIAAMLDEYPFEPTDPEGYAEYKRINSDGYGGGVVRYGEAWAALMEARLAEGPMFITNASIADAAEATQDEADSEGITGFMFGCAVQQLARFWKHGEALRVWHNAKHGVSAETTGVVNPAVLTISR